jgi:Ca2+-binding RTX toxin-like protein
VLRGTPDGDRIAGLGGDDIIRGFDGDDTICGGRGDDVVFGGGWDDFIRGGRGDDRLYEQLGDWGALNGGPGNDLLDGGVPRDRDEVNYRTARRGVNIDLVAGVAIGDGKDTLVNIGSVVGSPFDDTVYVGRSAPQLFELVTGDGNDTLTIGRGVTYPDGGYGDDTYNILEGASWDELDDIAGHDIYNVCNDRFSPDWAPAIDRDHDYEVHFC